jgi:hypothetical protein
MVYIILNPEVMTDMDSIEDHVLKLKKMGIIQWCAPLALTCTEIGCIVTNFTESCHQDAVQRTIIPDYFLMAASEDIFYPPFAKTFLEIKDQLGWKYCFQI